jgi:hypothetical protein
MHNFMALPVAWKLALVSVSLMAIGFGALLLNS